MLNLPIKNNKLYILIVLFCFNSILSSQVHRAIFKISSNPSGKYWWLENNNNGKYVTKNGIDFKWTFTQPSTTYQITLSDELSENGKLVLGESFIKHNFSEKTFLRLGKYYRDFSEYLNDELSSGSMMVSQNAQTIPKIGLVTHKKIRKNMVLNFGIAHGFLKKEDYYTEAPFLHEKFLYLHINHNKKNKLSIGFAHEAIWAGGSPESGEYPDTLKDFLKVFISADGPYEPPHANALGSHIGIWDFYYEKNSKEKKLKLYYQHFFEDTSSLRFANSIDGLWGIELKNYIPKTNLLVEYLDTTHSSGNSDYKNDYYYWNYQYRQGWVFKDRIIGNPFINTNNFTEEQMFKLAHIGMSGNIFSSQYEIKASRKIDIQDTIKFKFSFNKSLSKKINVTAFFVGEGNSNGIGFSISYIL